MTTNQLIIGGQRSGKSGWAERLGSRWLAEVSSHSVVVVATAVAGDREMHQRIERHKLDRPNGFGTFESPYELSARIDSMSSPERMIIIDCLPLWLTNWLMPAPGQAQRAAEWPAQKAAFLAALRNASGPVVIVSNEIGAGVIPLDPQVRTFVDELGRLNQDVAQACDTITWMVAGQPFTQKVQQW